MTTPRKTGQADLQADLLVDLAATVEPTAVVVPEPVRLPPAGHTATPSVSVHWTPLRWSRPRMGRAAAGPGKSLKAGPVTVELSFRG